MTDTEILSRVDHTLLTPIASWSDIQKLCTDALQYHTASVCIPSSYVGEAHTAFPTLTLCTVVGFPLGYANTAGKLAETKQALADGAEEIDMVVNLTDVKNGRFEAITKEIRALKDICGDHVLKVIVETCYLTEEEKNTLCHCVTDGGADYIKTSTGFGTAGATVDDVALFRKHIGPQVRIKAAGGIHTREEMLALIEAGADRLGASSAITALRS